MLNGRKVLFINLMINAGGMGVALFSTVGHGHALVMSDLSDDNLLQAIHQHKVGTTAKPCTVAPP